MKINIHDGLIARSNPLKLASPAVTFPTQGSSSFTQTLTSLREEDPAFNKVIHAQHYERGQLVATSDDLAQKMYVLMTGKVNLICTNHEGRRLVIATLEPGAVFGEGALDTPGDPNVL
ncbi:MAG: cyclic nucleotide-binding domain-containing protein [Leptolyngbyaceae cyanobacterium SU_3_3]|nr:cyclic nucleotide-binding domain-containing protein [Leptolyngbyaceae cyanobacterium SU_3_3]